jgi:hypothetical protein
MREHGFTSVACGPDGREARAIAKELNKRWDAVRAEVARRARRQVGHASHPIYQVLGALSWNLAGKLEDELERKRGSSQSEFCSNFVPRSALRIGPLGPYSYHAQNRLLLSEHTHRRIVKTISGVEGSLGGGWELSAADLADLLNKARMQWAGAPPSRRT